MNGTVIETIKYTFQPSEIVELAEKLQREMRRLMERKAEKKIASDRYSEQDGLCSALLRKVADGYEMREVEARVVLNTPRSGMKQIVYGDEVLREERMTEAERQEPLPFESQSKGGRK